MGYPSWDTNRKYSKRSVMRLGWTRKVWAFDGGAVQHPRILYSLHQMIMSFVVHDERFVKFADLLLLSGPIIANFATSV